jgi:hypothetical protein
MQLATGFVGFSQTVFSFGHWNNRVRQGLISRGRGFLATALFVDTRSFSFDTRRQTQRAAALRQAEMTATGARHYESFLDHNNPQLGLLAFDPNGRRIQRSRWRD